MQDLLTYTTFLLAIAFQCFVYCHGGTRLETESVAVANALYMGGWYEADVQTQRSVQLCVLRAQKAQTVRSVFFSANLSTLTSVSTTIVMCSRCTLYYSN